MVIDFDLDSLIYTRNAVDKMVQSEQNEGDRKFGLRILRYFNDMIEDEKEEVVKRFRIIQEDWKERNFAE